MKPIRMAACLAGAIALAASLLVYMEYVYMLGFPDGSITELGYARRRLAYVFISVSVVLAACFVYLGAVAARKKVGKKLAAASVLYLVAVVCLSLVERYYSSHLDDGVGG